jgi:hypothetical protein
MKVFQLRYILYFISIILISTTVLAQKDISVSPCIYGCKKPAGVCFKVHDVVAADSSLKVYPVKMIIGNKIGKEILFFPDEQNNFKMAVCPNNGLIQTVQECYDNHRPLVLSPDIIWLAICQGTAIHINEKYDSLKNVIFVENKPDKLIIRNDSLEYSAKHWKDLIESLSGETRKYTRADYYSFFVSEFSTTTQIEKTAYQVTLLESYKKTFEYIGESGCGIPTIQISGNTSDWQQIYYKLEILKKLGLTEWAENLKPVINEFILASKGKINTEFWKDIYKNATEYNAFYISGWIIKLFPYIKELELEGVFDEKTGLTRVGEILKPNPFIDGDRYLLSTLSTDNFPSGISKINVIWNNYYKNESKMIEVYGGFFGIKQFDDKSIEPFISWAICDEKAGAVAQDLPENAWLDLKHEPDSWSPHIASEIIDSAIYDIKKLKTYKKSIEFIRHVILDSLQNNISFKDIEYKGDTIMIEVLSNGKTGNVYMCKLKDNSEISDYIKKLLWNLPERWFPALVHPSEVMDVMDPSDEQKNIKVRANSIVNIIL